MSLSANKTTISICWYAIQNHLIQHPSPCRDQLLNPLMGWNQRFNKIEVSVMKEKNWLKFKTTAQEVVNMKLKTAPNLMMQFCARAVNRSPRSHLRLKVWAHKTCKMDAKLSCTCIVCKTGIECAWGCDCRRNNWMTRGSPARRMDQTACRVCSYTRRIHAMLSLHL